MCKLRCNHLVDILHGDFTDVVKSQLSVNVCVTLIATLKLTPVSGVGRVYIETDNGVPAGAPDCWPNGRAVIQVC